MNQTSKTIGKLLKFSGPFRITILLSAVFSAFSAVINLKAYLCVYGVAKVLIQSSGNFGALDLAAMKALGMQAVWYVCMGFGTYGMALLCSHISAYNTVARIRMQLIRHLGTLPLGYHILHPSGKQRKIIEKNTDNLETLIAHNIPDYVQSLVLPIAFLVFMFRYDWRLSLICLVPILIGFILLFSMLKGESSGFIGQVQKSGEDISNAATEYVRGIAVVKTFGQTASSFRRYQRAVKDYADFMTKYAFSMENAFSLYTTIVNAVFLFLIPGSIVLYNLGGGAEKTIMTFAFFAVLIPLVASILTKLMHSSSNLMLADASFTAIEEMLAEKPLAETKKLPVPQNGEICLNHVSFQYEAGVKALDDVSLTIRPGTVTALVGESGGGKSTHCKARVWSGRSEHKSGGIYMNTKDKSKLNGKDLISIGIFTAVYFILNLLIAAAMGFIPLVNMMIPFASSLVLGIPMMLYFSKIKKFGMVLITYIIYGAILTLAGVGIYSLIAGTLCALIAEFILKAKRYASISAAILSYAVCSVGANANVLGFAFMTEAQLAEKTAYYGQEYMDIISGYFSHGYMLPLLAITAFAGGALGGLLGKAVLKKHFAKSGMI